MRKFDDFWQLNAAIGVILESNPINEDTIDFVIRGTAAVFNPKAILGEEGIIFYDKNDKWASGKNFFKFEENDYEDYTFRGIRLPEHWISTNEYRFQLKFKPNVDQPFKYIDIYVKDNTKTGFMFAASFTNTEM